MSTGVALRQAWETFVSGGPLAPGVRDVVGRSWQRSRDLGVDAEASLPTIALAGDALEQYRRAHPLAATLPTIRSLLVEHATAEDLLVAIADASGRLLWVEGGSSARRRAEPMNFVEGACWDEANAGTNAPALALAHKRSASVAAAEHFHHRVQPWSCSAAPVLDPVSGDVLGVLDVTGDRRAATPAALALVHAAAAAVQAELQVQAMRAAVPVMREPDAHLVLRVLGPAAGTVEVHGAGGVRTVKLSPRHTELVLLLSRADEGRSADALACDLDDRFLDSVTVRAELSRLRKVLGADGGRDIVGSRPYRLLLPCETDVDVVRGHLDGSRRREALAAYRGPILPGSQAPGVARLRDELHAEMRAALLTEPQPDLLRQWLASEHGSEDYTAWRAAVRVSDEGSAERARLTARLRVLDARHGA